jgi:hypothetical protein
VRAFAAIPVPAFASAEQTMTFEAPRELLDDGTRDATLDEIQKLGVDRHPPARLLARLRAGRRLSARRPSTPPTQRPTRGHVARLDRLFAAAGDSHISIQLTLTGPVPKWATMGPATP